MGGGGEVNIQDFSPQTGTGLLRLSDLRSRILGRSSDRPTSTRDVVVVVRPCFLLRGSGVVQ